MIDDDIAIEWDDPIQTEELLRRSDFLRSLRKWSQAVIDAIVFEGLGAPPEARGDWVNRLANWGDGAGIGSWVNRSGSWSNGGGGGVNRRGW